MNWQKAAVAIILSAATALVTALGTSPQQNLSHLGWIDWLTVIGAILGSGGIVYFTENGAAHLYIKAVVGAGGAFVTALITAYADNIVSQAEWITAFAAAIVAFAAVFQTTNGVRVVQRQ